MIRRQSLDIPQNRQFVELCLLRVRRHGPYIIFTSFVHDISSTDNNTDTSSSGTQTLQLICGVFIDAVFSHNRVKQMNIENKMKLKIFSPFHAISIDGNYPFPLLLGTDLVNIIEPNHQCNESLPFKDDC